MTRVVFEPLGCVKKQHELLVIPTSEKQGNWHRKEGGRRRIKRILIPLETWGACLLTELFWSSLLTSQLIDDNNQVRQQNCSEKSIQFIKKGVNWLRLNNESFKPMRYVKAPPMHEFFLFFFFNIYYLIQHITLWIGRKTYLLDSRV